MFVDIVRVADFVEFDLLYMMLFPILEVFGYIYSMQRTALCPRLPRFENLDLMPGRNEVKLAVLLLAGYKSELLA